MKRRPPAEILIDAPSPRRKRVLSEEERALWDSVTKQARPLRKKARVAKFKAAPAADAAPPRATCPVKRMQGESSSSRSGPAKASRPPSPPPLSPLGRRERTHLSRGRIEIDARLDLHGMTQARAHRALLHFLQRASGDGLRFVLVVRQGQRRGAGIRTRRAAPASAGMAVAAGVSRTGRRLRAGACRPRRRGRALCARAARAVRFKCHSGVRA